MRRQSIPLSLAAASATGLGAATALPASAASATSPRDSSGMTSAKASNESGKPRARRRLLAAALSVAALAGTSTVLATSSAYAATPGCASYHSWTECIGYNRTTETYTLTVHNGYSVSEYETVWMNVEGTTYSWSLTIPSLKTDAFNVSPLGQGQACAGIDSVTLGCWDY